MHAPPALLCRAPPHAVGDLLRPGVSPEPHAARGAAFARREEGYMLAGQRGGGANGRRTRGSTICRRSRRRANLADHRVFDDALPLPLGVLGEAIRILRVRVVGRCGVWEMRSQTWGLRGACVPMRAQASDWAPSKRRSMGAAACGQSGRGLERPAGIVTMQSCRIFLELRQ